MLFVCSFLRLTPSQEKLTDGGRHVVFWKAREAWYQFCMIRKSTMSMSRKRVGTKRSLLFQTEKISISLSKWDLVRFYSQKVWRTLLFFDLKKKHKTTTYLSAKFRDKEQNTDRLTYRNRLVSLWRHWLMTCKNITDCVNARSIRGWSGEI